MDTELKERLTALAYAKTHPFCYCCYKRAPSGRCLNCYSDDLMRELPGVGVEYGTDWVIESLVSENLTEADTERAFEETVSECYPETVKIGWIEYDTASAIKELDPTSWQMAEQEWIDQELDDGTLVEIKGKYYSAHDVESYLDSQELPEVSHG